MPTARLIDLFALTLAALLAAMPHAFAQDTRDRIGSTRRDVSAAERAQASELAAQRAAAARAGRAETERQRLTAERIASGVGCFCFLPPPAFWFSSCIPSMCS